MVLRREGNLQQTPARPKSWRAPNQATVSQQRRSTPLKSNRTPRDEKGNGPAAGNSKSGKRPAAHSDGQAEQGQPQAARNRKRPPPTETKKGRKETQEERGGRKKAHEAPRTDACARSRRADDTRPGRTVIAARTLTSRPTEHGTHAKKAAKR